MSSLDDKMTNAAASSGIFSRSLHATLKAADAYPAAEHHQLVAAHQQDTVTDLRLLMYYFQLDINQYEKRYKNDPSKVLKARGYKKIAREWYLFHRPSTKGPEHTLDLWINGHTSLVFQHVITQTQILGLQSAAAKKLLKPTANYAGELNINLKDRAKQSLKAMAHPSLADDPFDPPANWDTVRNNLALEQLGYTATPTSADADKLAAYNRTIADLDITFRLFREMFNHTFMWVTTVFCHKDTVAQFRQLHQKHLRAVALHSGGDPPTFTVKKLFAFLREKCTTPNLNVIEKKATDIKKLVRKKGMTPIQWLDLFPQALADYEDLLEDPLDEDDHKALWKITFGHNLSQDDNVTMVVQASNKAHITPTNYKKIANYREGEFDTAIMGDYLQSINSLFKKYDPAEHRDITSWNAQNWSSRGYDVRSLSYDGKGAVPPSHKRHRDPPKKERGRPAQRPKRPPLRQASAPLLSNSVPAHMQRTNPYCRNKGIRVYSTHTLADCKNKHLASSSTGNPPTVGNRSHSSSHTGPPSHKGGKGKGKGKGKPPKGSHGRGASASKGKGTNPRDRLQDSPHFRKRLRQSFYTKELQQCANHIIDTYDTPYACLTCLESTCDGFCDPNSEWAHTVYEAKEIMANNPDLGRAIRAAMHDDCEEADARADFGPVNTESFYASTIGGATATAEHDLFAPDSDQDKECSDNTYDTDQHDLFDPDNTLSGREEDDQDPQFDDIESPLRQPTELEGDNSYNDDVLSQYFSLGTTDANPLAWQLDQKFGLTVTSPVYWSLTDETAEQTSSICEAFIKVTYPDRAPTRARAKIDNCNSRFTAGEKYLHDIKPCYAYGLVPIRMRTASKQPTAWRR